MKRIYLITVLMLVAFQAVAETPHHPDELVLSDLTFEMPIAEETFLSNGIRLLIFENHDLPLVHISAYLSTGSRYLTPDRYPVNRVLNRVWDEGGIGDLSADEVDVKKAALGITLNSGVSYAKAYVQTFMVREDLQDGVAMWGDLLLRPRFDQERIDRAKEQIIKDIEGANDNPDRLAELWFRRLLAGEGTPGWHNLTSEEIYAVTQEELQDLYEYHIRPERVVVGISGDITMDEAVDLLEPLVGNWKSETEAEDLEPFLWERKPKPGLYLLPGDFEQCHLRMGSDLPDLTDLSADFPEVKLLDFGVGYLRVYYRTRSEGLSYGTGTRFIAGMDRGKFYAMGSSKPEKIIQLISSVREEIDGLSTRPLDKDECETVRSFILGTKIQGMETARDIVSERLREIVLGQPDDYTASFIAGIQAASVESMARVANRYINFGPETVVLVVGNPEGGVEALEALGLGPVTVLESIKFGQ